MSKKKADSKYHARTFEEKLKALKDVDKGEKKSTVAKNLGVPLSTLSTWIKNRDKIEATVLATGSSGQRKRQRNGRFEDVEQALLSWFREARRNSIPISGPIIAAKATHLAERLDVEDFKCSVGWLNRFKARHGIMFRKISGEEREVNDAVLSLWKEKIASDILEKYSPSDIFNADETALFYRMLPTKSFVEKGDTCKGTKQSKERLSVLVACSMSGERLPLLVIGKSKNPRCFKGIKNLPTAYDANKNAWMTGVIFSSWIRTLDKQMAKQKRKVCMVVDNCAAHPHVSDLTNVELIFLPPNTTAKSQPCDQGVIHSLKSHYRRQVLEKIIHHIDQGHEMEDMKINVLDALRILQEAWCQVSANTIRNCFHHCGFSCDTDEEDLENPQIFSAYATLQERSCIPEDMDPEDYLHIDDDVPTCAMSTDDDIVEAVLSARMENDDEQEDDCCLVQHQPINKAEAFECIDKLKMYFEQCDHLSDSPISAFEYLSKVRSELMQTRDKTRQSTLDQFFTKV